MVIRYSGESTSVACSDDPCVCDFIDTWGGVIHMCRSFDMSCNYFLMYPTFPVICLLFWGLGIDCSHHFVILFFVHYVSKLIYVVGTIVALMASFFTSLL